MKKMLYLCLILMVALQTVASAEYWKAKDLYYKFDFTNDKTPEIKEISGHWETEALAGENDSILYDFENDYSDFVPILGSWEIKDGKYIQTEEGVSKTTRTLLNNFYDEFNFAFDITPKSEDNTLIIYFGYESEKKYNSIEINSYQSKLVLNGEETVGQGSIIKDEKYRIQLKILDGEITLSCNGISIFTKKDVPQSLGKIGIGTWNSKMEFDNGEISKIHPLGNEKKLIGSASGEALSLFEDLSAGDFIITAPIAAKSFYTGEIGIGARIQANADGYYVGITKNSICISKKKDGKKSVLKKEKFKPQSIKYYDMSVICDGEKIGVLVDGKEVLSAEDKDFDNGICGFFSVNTTIYCENVTMSLLEYVSPPIVSAGNTVYYIDSENGNDKNDGITPKTAWKSLDKPMQCKFTAGDTVLLKRGKKYEGTLKFRDIAAKADDKFVLSAYGEGSSPLITACQIGIDIENCNNIQISEIDMNLRHFGTKNNHWIGEGYGVLVKNCQNVILTNCNFSGSGADANSFAVYTDSDRTFDEITTVKSTFDNFSINDVCVNGEINTNTTNKNHWAYSYMNKLIHREIINEYRPDDSVTRAEFSTMLLGALSLKESEYRGTFKDITKDEWYASKLQTVSDYRMLPSEMTIGGVANAEAPLLREEAAAMAVLAIGTEFSGEYEYTDFNDADLWAVKYIKQASYSGIMTGKGDGKFYPSQCVTRGEAAVILCGIMEKLGGAAQ